MFKGTKGKWFIECEPFESNNEYHGSFDVVTHKRKQVVAQVAAYSFYGQTLETSKYNALLISKAPEMLEMLRKAHDFIDDSGVQSGANDILNKIDQLIKEATEL